MFSSSKARLYADRLRQLERLGLSTPFESNQPKNTRSDVAITQHGIDLDSPIVDLQGGRTLYVVWLSLVAERPGVNLYDYRFEPPWPDRNFEMLPGFTESCVGEAYVLPNQLEYSRADILNFRFGKTGWRLPYTRVEGVLCALSATPIPEEFKHGTPVPVGLKFFSRSGHQLAAASVVLWADRWHEPAAPRPSAQPPDAPAEADPGAAAEPLRSALYDQREGTDLLAAGRQPEKGSPPEAKLQEGRSGTGLFGE